jgi:hypothetical protein
MDEKKHSGGGLSSGFLLGVVVGVIITLVLTTKRGKRILKLITEEGIHKLSDFEGVFDDMIEEYEHTPAEPTQKPVELLEHVEEDDEEMEEEEEVPAVHPIQKAKAKKSESKVSMSKRFFKGIHRRSVN